MKKTLRKPVSRSVRTYFILTIAVAMVIVVYFLSNNRQSANKRDQTKEPQVGAETNAKPLQNGAFQRAKIVHLDLKGAPPKITYYATFFPLLHKMGATGILIEYEDMFPYSSFLNISALNAYTLQDIATINSLAQEHGLEVIPLVQTFGHLEFVLKLEQYQDLREIQDYPQVICPTNNRSDALLMRMIDEVVQAHKNIKMLHIGSDEVYYLGYCDRCSGRMTRNNWSKNQLFLDHVRAIVSRIHDKYPQLTLLMWDDEFRGFSADELEQSEDLKAIGAFVRPVVWKYGKDVYEELGPSLWESYGRVFKNVWVASAFKGATGSAQYVNDVTYYMQNHRSWLSLIAEHASLVHFDGIILTGWQRYDHFAVLCELLPVSLPALAMCLRLLHGEQDSPLSPPREVARILECEQPYGLIGPAFGSPKCSFAGADILEHVVRLHQLQTEFEAILEDSRIKGWFGHYNRKHDFSNRQYALAATAPLQRMMHELVQLQRDIGSAMGEIYDRYTVEEWRETFLEPLVARMQRLLDARARIARKSVWPRRPLLASVERDDL